MMKKALLVCVSLMLVATIASADMVVYDDAWKYPLSGWMGEKSSGYPATASLTVTNVTSDGGATPYQGTHFNKITYDKTKETWAGIYSQYSAAWQPVGGGKGTDLLGYTYLTLRARAIVDNVKVKFGLGEALDSCGTLDAPGNPQNLTMTSWQEFKVEGLDGYNMADVNGLFYFSITAADNAALPNPISFYIDDVKYAGGAQGVVTVTIIGGTVGVSIEGTIDLGNVNAGDIVTASGYFTVTNIGNVPENYKLSLINPGGWQAQDCPSGTNPASLQAHNKYVLMALFTGEAIGSPPTVFGNDGNDSLITTLRAASDTNYSDSTITDKGWNVTAGAKRRLWIRFWAPTSTSVSVQQKIIIAITAEKYIP